MFAGRGDLALLPMRQLRDIGKHRSLRGVALTDIAEILRARGLQHLPLRLPPDQNRHIVVWKPGTPGTELLERIRWLSTEAGRYKAAAQPTETEVCQLYRAALSERDRSRRDS
jgi:hypothetical protein